MPTIPWIGSPMVPVWSFESTFGLTPTSTNVATPRPVVTSGCPIQAMSSPMSACTVESRPRGMSIPAFMDRLTRNRGTKTRKPQAAARPIPVRIAIRTSMRRSGSSCRVIPPED